MWFILLVSTICFVLGFGGHYRMEILREARRRRENAIWLRQCKMQEVGQWRN